MRHRLILALAAALLAGSAHSQDCAPGHVGPIVGDGVGYGYGYDVPYPREGTSPYHWIYGYLPTWDSTYGRYGTLYHRYGGFRADLQDPVRRPETLGPKVKGRTGVDPAVPFDDYLRSRRESQLRSARPEPTADKALIEIHVPHENARLFLDGQQAAGQEDGKVRFFLTPSLAAGQEYRYRVKAVWPDVANNFADVEEEAVVVFRAQEHKIVTIRRKN